MITNIRKCEELEFVIRYPDEYCSAGKYPILFFLHGAGTRGNDISAVLENPFFKLTCDHDLPFITVAPQCPADTWWDVYEELVGLVKYIYTAKFTDRARIYAIGASMGGYAAWQLGMSCPEIFAAIVPICGGGMYWNAARLKNTPVWAFHGDCDPTVGIDESRKMVEAVNRCGGNARLTVYEGCGHDAWSETYSNKEVFKWLLKHRTVQTDKPSDKFNNPELYG